MIPGANIFLRMEPKTKVIIVGAGIAGPVLAVFLKLKGYDPIVYERVDALADVGLALWYVTISDVFVL